MKKLPKLMTSHGRVAPGRFFAARFHKIRVGAFSSHQNRNAVLVTAPRELVGEPQRSSKRCTAIQNYFWLVFFDAPFHVGEDSARVFIVRVFVGENDRVAVLIGNRTHFGAFGAIAPAAGVAQSANTSAVIESFVKSLERFGSMGIINDHGKSLALFNTLGSPGNKHRPLESALYDPK